MWICNNENENSGTTWPLIKMIAKNHDPYNYESKIYITSNCFSLSSNQQEVQDRPR